MIFVYLVSTTVPNSSLLSSTLPCTEFLSALFSIPSLQEKRFELA